MQRSKKGWFIFSLFSMLTVMLLNYELVSCSDNFHYQKTYDFKNRIWTNRDSVIFSINIDDTTALYRFELTLRTTTEYAYSNLWLLWKSKTPTNERVSEPFELKIATPEGIWIGTKSGSMLSNHLTFADKKMPHIGKYVFTIKQSSNIDEVKEVLDIGLKVYKIKEADISQRKKLNTEPITSNSKKNK